MIASAKRLEKMLSDGTISIDRDVGATTEYGLRVDVLMKKISDDKPIIYTYVYKLDSIKFKQWLEEHAYLCEGPLAFIAKGIQVVTVGGAKKWDKTAFSIDSDKKDGEKYFLPLLSREIKFAVHRDLFSGEEWDVTLLDAEDIDELSEVIEEKVIG